MSLTTAALIYTTSFATYNDYKILSAGNGAPIKYLGYDRPLPFDTWAMIGRYHLIPGHMTNRLPTIPSLARPLLTLYDASTKPQLPTLYPLGLTFGMGFWNTGITAMMAPTAARV